MVLAVENIELRVNLFTFWYIKNHYCGCNSATRTFTQYPCFAAGRESDQVHCCCCWKMSSHYKNVMDLHPYTLPPAS
ncbi:hypothetical protein P3S67_011638 [Capsicum chacoense]